MRKKEREFERLRDQLQSCLREPAALIATATKIENLIDPRNQQPQRIVSHSNSMLDFSSEEDPSTGADYQSHDRAEMESQMGAQLDRIELLEHENANMRQLLSSINQILAEMRNTVNHHFEGQDNDPENMPKDLSSQLSTLPISWIYDQVKEEIESSLSLLSDVFRSQ